MAGNVLFGRGFSVSKEGTSEGAGAVCHPHQGRDTLKGWQPVWATCARAGTPLIDWNPWRTDAGAEEKHQDVKSSRGKLLHAAPVSWDGSKVTCHTHRESWDEMRGKGKKNIYSSGCSLLFPISKSVIRSWCWLSINYVKISQAERVLFMKTPGKRSSNSLIQLLQKWSSQILYWMNMQLFLTYI